MNTRRNSSVPLKKRFAERMRGTKLLRKVANLELCQMQQSMYPCLVCFAYCSILSFSDLIQNSQQKGGVKLSFGQCVVNTSDIG